MNKNFRKSNILFCAFSILISLFIILPNVYGINYTYDDAGRLTKARYDNWKIIKYKYDPAGNMTSRIITTTTEPENHTLESAHPSFIVIEMGKKYEISLKNGESAKVSVKLIAEDGSLDVNETEVAASIKRVDVDTLNQSTTNGAAEFNVTGRGKRLASVTFTTNVGTLKLKVRK